MTELESAFAALEKECRALSARHDGKVGRGDLPPADRLSLAGIDGALSRLTAARKLMGIPEPRSDYATVMRAGAHTPAPLTSAPSIEALKVSAPTTSAPKADMPAQGSLL